MKLGTSSIAVVVLVSGLLLSILHAGGDWASIVPNVHADDLHAIKTCSNATLNGSYGFYRTGTIPLPDGSRGSLAAVGILFFDGNGNSTATQSISRNGVFTFDVVGSGPYEVAEDCTGKGFTDSGVELFRFVIVDGGEGLYALSETSGNAVYEVVRRIHTPERDDHR
jgi:hypothetical protein